jgi:hypothetical protein
VCGVGEGAESIDNTFVFAFNDLVVVAYAVRAARVCLCVCVSVTVHEQSYKCVGIYQLATSAVLVRTTGVAFARMLIHCAV